MTIRLLTLSTFEPHPQAPKETVSIAYDRTMFPGITCVDWPVPLLEVIGDLLVVVLFVDGDVELWAMNWKANRVLMVIHPFTERRRRLLTE